MTGWQLLVAVLASYRLTRVVTIDTLWKTTRDGLVLWAGQLRHRRVATPVAFLGEKLAELVECPWCTGVWVSGAVTCAVLRTWPWDLGLAGLVLVFTVAGGQGLVSHCEATAHRFGEAAEAAKKLMDHQQKPSSSQAGAAGS